jgi:hypothetical protein
MDGLHFDGDFAADLFHQLRQPGCGTPPYRDLIQDPYPVLSTSETTPRGKIIRRCELNTHSVTINERRTKSTVEEFSNSVKDVLEAMGEVREDHPPMFSQRCRIQSLWKPIHGYPPLILLSHFAANVGDKVDPFGRPPSFFGLRFRFTPADDEDVQRLQDAFPGMEAKHDFVTVRYEVYSADVDFVWIEVASTRFFQIDITDSELIQQNIREAYNFVTKNAVEFLEQFDHSPPDDDGDSDESEDDDEHNE